MVFQNTFILNIKKIVLNSIYKVKFVSKVSIKFLIKVTGPNLIILNIEVKSSQLDPLADI